MYLVTAFTNPHEEVIRFNVSMNEILVVEIFNATDHLEKKNIINFQKQEKVTSNFFFTLVVFI